MATSETHFVGSRYSEQIKLKQQAALAREENLQAMSLFLAAGGPGM